MLASILPLKLTGVRIEPSKGSTELGNKMFRLLEDYIGSEDAEKITESMIDKVHVLEIVKILLK